MTFIVLSIALVALAMSAFFSGAETGLYCANRLRIELGAQERDPRSVRLAQLLRDEQGILTVTLLGATLTDYVMTSAVAFGFVRLMEMTDVDAEIYTVIVCTPILFVFGSVVPKNIFQMYADTLMPRAAWLLGAASQALRWTGMIAFLKGLAAQVGRLAGMSTSAVALPSPRWRVANLLREALADQEHGRDRSELITRVVRLSETPLHAVMVPKPRVVSVNIGANRPEWTAIARRAEHALYPVQDSAGRVLGVVKLDELLKSRESATISDRLRPITRLGPHTTIAAAISSLQSHGRTMAVVADHAGRILGLVTLGDLVIEIVGEKAGR